MAEATEATMATKETKATKTWDGLMLQVQQETVLLCDCVQKGLIDNGMVMIQVTRDDDGNAFVAIGSAIPDEAIEKVDNERQARKQ